MLEKKIKALVCLGDYLRSFPKELEETMSKSFVQNQWFTIENQRLAIQAIANDFLTEQNLQTWLKGYEMEPNESKSKVVGLVMAGNLPLVGFHDWLCTYVSGHQAAVKLSEKDPYLLPFLTEIISRFDPAVRSQTQFVTRLNLFDAVIATGSDNASRYFESYFGKYPHIIRKNRNALAILTGKETDEELSDLGKDVFSFFGLGCRNVSKIMAPTGYDFSRLSHAFAAFEALLHHNKYRNNFDYRYTIALLNRQEHIQAGPILLMENPAIASPIAILHYSFYFNEMELLQYLETNRDFIQCIGAANSWTYAQPATVSFGKTQSPALWDYADGVDTLGFLTKEIFNNWIADA